MQALFGECPRMVQMKKQTELLSEITHGSNDGDTTLANFIDLLHGFDATCTDVPVLGANIVPGPTSKLKGNILNYTIKTVEGQPMLLIMMCA